MLNKRYPQALLVFVFTALFSGCVSYVPVPLDYHGPLARINDSSTSVSSTKMQFFELVKVDGRSVDSSSAATYRKNQGRGFVMEPQVASREVPATTCVLNIDGTTYVAAPILAFGGGMYHVDGAVTVTLEPSKVYFVKGVLGKDYCAVWLEDSDGKVVSSRVEKGVKLGTTANQVLVPATTAVTPATDAPVAPPAAAAHL